MRPAVSVSGKHQIVENLQRVLEPVVGEDLVRLAFRRPERLVGQTDLDN